MSAGLRLAHLVGIDLGPLVVTAATHDHELTVRCPACLHRFQIEKSAWAARSLARKKAATPG